MAAQAQAVSPSKRSGVRWVFLLITGIACFGLLAYLLFQIVDQFVVPTPAHRLRLIQDVPLPSGLPTSAQEKLLVPGAAQETLLAPGVAVDFDAFDFQALDVATHRLFIAHSGPSPDLLALDKNGNFNATRNGPVDGNIIVFNTQQQKIIARINIPQVTGVLAAPDLNEVFAPTHIDRTIVNAIV